VNQWFAEIMTLREIFKKAKGRSLPKEWLYLPADSAWTPDTEGVFLDLDSEEKDEQGVPLIAKCRDLKETLDDGTIEQVVDWADRLSGRDDDAARLDVFRCYYRFDAFPDRLGAPDPPPADEMLRRLDLQFYDSLGPEATGTKCRKEGCGRGTTRFSVFCRRHQFEQVKKKPCPFQH